MASSKSEHIDVIPRILDEKIAKQYSQRKADITQQQTTEQQLPPQNSNNNDDTESVDSSIHEDCQDLQSTSKPSMLKTIGGYLLPALFIIALIIVIYIIWKYFTKYRNQQAENATKQLTQATNENTEADKEEAMKYIADEYSDSEDGEELESKIVELPMPTEEQSTTQVTTQVSAGQSSNDTTQTSTEQSSEESSHVPRQKKKIAKNTYTNINEDLINNLLNESIAHDKSSIMTLNDDDDELPPLLEDSEEDDADDENDDEDADDENDDEDEDDEDDGDEGDDEDDDEDEDNNHPIGINGNTSTNDMSFLNTTELNNPEMSNSDINDILNITQSIPKKTKSRNSRIKIDL